MGEVVHTRAAVLSIGDELVRGQALDTNSRWVSARLERAGIEVAEHVIVGDDAGAIADALRRLAGVAPLVVATGGLGPTDDDLTRDGLAAVLGEELVEDADALARLTDCLRSRGRELTPGQRLQALRPRGAECLANDAGTAPGLAARVVAGGREADVYCLPGPPGELAPMFERLVTPRLRPEPGVTVRTRFIKVVGVPEAEAAGRVPGLMNREANPLVGITASGGVLTWRIRYRGSLAAAEAEAAVEGAAARIYRAMGEHVLGEGDATTASRVVELLRERGRTLAVVESCTGGMLGEMLTRVSGASAAFVGGLVTYSNALKERLAGVSAETLAGHGAASAACAAEMAAGGLERAGADYCLSITGIAGPEGGSAAKPVGTVFIGLAAREGAAVRTWRLLIPGGREDVRERSATSALTLLYFELTRGGPPGRLLWEVG